MVKLRGNLTEAMEAKPGKVHFRRWKAMSIGSRISLIVLVLIVMIAVFANILAPHDPFQIFTARQAPDAEFLFGTEALYVVKDGDKVEFLYFMGGGAR